MHPFPMLNRVRVPVMSGAVIALIATALALVGPNSALGQDAVDCEVTDLGTLGSEAGSVLEAEGRWTTEDCDSRFRSGSDAHTYRFQLEEAGRVRIGLTSAEADSYLYLLAEDGSRITDNDDNGARLDSRVERDLEPGTYLVEATTVGGRTRGPADFKLTVSRVDGCDIVDLGSLEPGIDLAATGTWSLETCGSRFVSVHPAHTYSFNLAEAARVRIDLVSASGDPVLSLASLEQGIVGADDDGGERRNSRIEQYLPAGLYFIEATTYYARDLQPLQADFTLTVHRVDEAARQQRAQIKIEAVHTPAVVVEGDPFPVHYRVGNVGGGEVPDDGSHARLWVVGPGVVERLVGLSGIWDAGVAYHTGDEAAISSSAEIDDITPFEATFNRHGPTWIFVGSVTDDAEGNEIGFHGLWHNLMVLSGPTFDPVDVGVEGTVYTVSASADSDGEVTTTVRSATGLEGEIDRDVRAKAVYAAGVRTQLLDGIFERPAIAELPRTADPSAVTVPDPSSKTLLTAIGEQFASADGIADLRRALTRREAINPVMVEESVLGMSRAALSQYAPMADSWASILEQVGAGEPLSFDDAFAVHSQLAYAERLISPAVTAGELVTAARAADRGWDDLEVKEMMADYASCDPRAGALRGALEAAGIANIGELLVLDAEVRVVRPIHGLAIDAALCAATEADRDNSLFLRRLSISSNAALRRLVRPEATTAPAPESHRLRILARIDDDGRIEHAVELDSGRRVLPSPRFLDADAPVGTWQFSGEIRVWPHTVGKVRSRPLADGRVELGFISADGTEFTPDIAYVPAGAPTGVWFRSGQITVPTTPMMGR